MNRNTQRVEWLYDIFNELEDILEECQNNGNGKIRPLKKKEIQHLQRALKTFDQLNDSLVGGGPIPDQCG